MAKGFVLLAAFSLFCVAVVVAADTVCLVVSFFSSFAYFFSVFELQAVNVIATIVAMITFFIL